MQPDGRNSERYLIPPTSTCIAWNPYWEPQEETLPQPNLIGRMLLSIRDGHLLVAVSITIQVPLSFLSNRLANVNSQDIMISLPRNLVDKNGKVKDIRPELLMHVDAPDHTR